MKNTGTNIHVFSVKKYSYNQNWEYFESSARAPFCIVKIERMPHF